MAPKLTWDGTGARVAEAGVSKGVIYPVDENGAYPIGYAWNGLTNVTKSPSGGEPNDMWADGMKYLSLMGAETLGLSIEAYTYPDAFAECDGSKQVVAGVNVGQQARKKFGFVFRTEIADDVSGLAAGYKLHLIYNCLAAPSERSYDTINESPEGAQFSWEVSTTPVKAEGYLPSSEIVINSTTVDPTALTALEELLYGTAGTPGTDATLPAFADVLAIFEA